MKTLNDQWKTCKHALTLRMPNKLEKSTEVEITAPGCQIAENNWIGGPKCTNEKCEEYKRK